MLNKEKSTPNEKRYEVKWKTKEKNAYKHGKDFRFKAHFYLRVDALLDCSKESD